ncbi:hypothetical protein BC834DRAFT_898619 [Gloeopeniophorella convolvens]|nr:hypothetical protein BC834DRAFT_898619 [Gloeopeniophorella convolvens]
MRTSMSKPIRRSTVTAPWARAALRGPSVMAAGRRPGMRRRLCRVCASSSTRTVAHAAGTYSRAGVPDARRSAHSACACVPLAESARRCRPGCVMCRAGDYGLTVLRGWRPCVPRWRAACVRNRSIPCRRR